MADFKTIGLIINPIAGMGGSVGLKGSDGEEILNEARKLGAEPQAPRRAKEFLEELKGLRTRIKVYTLSGVMGGDIVKELGFEMEIIQDENLPESTELFKTKPNHTITAAKKMKEKGVSLIVFVGGDGTARNIFEAVDTDIPCLGVPGGVKIHSSVFATTPKAAGQLTLQYLWDEAPLREAEVLDINEDAFRNNEVISKLYGYMKCPYSPTFSQPSKMGSPHTEDETINKQGIARWIIEEMEEKEVDTYYLIGPGTTTKAIADELEEEKTLLGADLFYHKRCIAKDLNEEQILEQITGRKTKLIVTPIGAQGFVFGRGNLQLSPKVLREVGFDNIMIIATKYKISTLPDGKLRIDSRDPEFDEEFRGYYRILMDYGEFRIVDLI